MSFSQLLADAFFYLRGWLMPSIHSLATYRTDSGDNSLNALQATFRLFNNSFLMVSLKYESSKEDMVEIYLKYSEQAEISSAFLACASMISAFCTGG